MSPIEATVRIMENWSVTGKLADLNVGQTFDLTKEVLAVFSNVKPPRKTKQQAQAPVGPPVENQWD